MILWSRYKAYKQLADAAEQLSDSFAKNSVDLGRDNLTYPPRDDKVGEVNRKG